MDLGQLDGFFALWNNAQGPMLREKRWGNFPDYGQTLVEHANSILLVGRLVLSIAARPVDSLLFMDCVILHDHGEPLTGGDEHAGNKTQGKDVKEWVAFERLLQTQPKSLYEPLLRAFTLQYVRKKGMWRNLPAPGGLIIIELERTHAYEAGLFEFVERFDYVLSAYAGYQRGVQNTQETMLEHTLGNQISKLDALTDEFPELGALWSYRLKAELQALVLCSL